MKSSIVLTALAMVILGACTQDSPKQPLAPVGGPALNSFANSEWSDPVHLPPPINSAGSELGAQLSPDGLSIYFGSDRSPGGQGGVDIWAVRRECLECPWGDAVDLTINSAVSDGSPAFSADGHFLFFSSDRALGHGGDDIWVSYREDASDDLGWQTPVNLGPGVNTAGHETGPVYEPALHAEGANLYFSRGGAAAGDIYRALITQDGETIGEAVPVAVLNSSGSETEPALSHDGKEIFFSSTRLGLNDIFVATRKTPNAEWSAPVPLSAINTAAADLLPGLSRDGRTLLWSAAAAARPSLGRQDIWMVTRSPGRRD